MLGGEERPGVGIRNVAEHVPSRGTRERNEQRAENLGQRRGNFKLASIYPDGAAYNRKCTQVEWHTKVIDNDRHDGQSEAEHREEYNGPTQFAAAKTQQEPSRHHNIRDQQGIGPQRQPRNQSPTCVGQHAPEPFLC